MTRRAIVLSFLAACATAAEDPLALNDPLRQLIVDTTTKGDGDFLTRTEKTAPPDADNQADLYKGGISFDQRDPVVRFRQTGDTNAIPQLARITIHSGDSLNFR